MGSELISTILAKSKDYSAAGLEDRSASFVAMKIS